MKLYTDDDKYQREAAHPLVEAYDGAVRALVRRRLAESGAAWADFVFGASQDLVTKDDMVEIERRILAHGYRFQGSASISVEERPDAYVGGEDAEEDGATFDHPDAPEPKTEDGRTLRGVGDNVVKHDANVTGTVRYIRSPAVVLKLLSDGVPDGTVAIIDDAGGTLTAPILEQFQGIICAGGTVRSHLGILSREYGIPCLMNAKVSGIREGDTVELEVSAPAKTAQAYQKNQEMTANIWVVET